MIFIKTLLGVTERNNLSGEIRGSIGKMTKVLVMTILT